MAYSLSILAYSDIQAALDEALAAERGIRVDFDGTEEEIRKKCTIYIHRCNAFRKAMRSESKRIHAPGDKMFGRSEYERLKLSHCVDHVKIEMWDSMKVKVTAL